MKEEKTVRSELVVYASDSAAALIGITFDGETLWLTQEQIASLFQTTKQNVSKHIRNIFDEGELDRATTVNEKLIVVEGKVVGEVAAMSTHYDVGKEVRQAIQRIDGILPEDLAVEPENITKVRARVETKNQRALT